MVAADADPRFVARHVVDAVRDRLARRLAREVVHLHVLRRLRRLPLPAGVLEFPDQFLLLRVDGDHRLALLQEGRGRRVDVLELGVAIGMLLPFAGLPQRLETVAERVQQASDGARTHAQPSAVNAAVNCACSYTSSAAATSDRRA